MKNSTLKSCLIIVFFSLFSIAQAQKSIWIETDQTEDYVFDEITFKQLTSTKNTLSALVVIEFPDGKGNLDKYRVVQTQTMHPELRKKFSGIKTYAGVSENQKKINFTYCEEIGINGFIIGKENKTKITPQTSGKHQFSIIEDETFSGLECNTISEVQSSFSFGNVTARDVNDSKLRKYRLALSVSGEYSQSFLNGSEINDNERLNKVMIAIVNSVNRLNGIFETDLGVQMELVEDNDQLIFLNQFSDPYSTGDSLNIELQTELDEIIGNENYDVGHLYHREPRIYGNAGCIACVCTAGQKGSGFTVHSDPTLDGINLIAAHEFGHQFGAYHTQSSSQCRSGFNSEVEPGSGSTIMSYAGICGPNVQLISDDYFNYTSIRDIAEWTINNSDCAEIVNIQNSAPIVNAGRDKVIPISTAFVLDAEASDADNDLLTYCWEQNDSEDVFSASTPSSNQSVGPIFRSFSPSTSSKRYFPSLEDVVLGNLTPTWEVIPSVSRDVNLVATVRDNNTEGGQVSSDAIKISTTSDAGPFIVTSQNTANVVWTVGSEVNVTWDVANTDTFPVNTTEVEILLSTNGGQTFDNSLLVTPNDGQVNFILPNVDRSEEARIIVKAVDNVFYAVNERNFTIEKSEFILVSDNNIISSCDNLEAVFDIEYITFLEFQETVNLSILNLPEGITQTFSKSVFTGSNTTGESFTLTLGSLDSVVEKEYIFTVVGISEGTIIEKELVLSLTTFDGEFTTPITTSPSNDEDSVDVESLLFQWNAIEDAENYTIEVASNENFGNLIISNQLTDNVFVTSSLAKDSTYFWRVNYNNDCGVSGYSAINSFKTACTAPNNIRVENISISSAEVIWDEEATTAWEVEYGVQGFAIGSGQAISTEVNELVLENLDSGTTYDIYVRSACSIGGFSTASNVISITTLANYCDGDKFYDTGGLNGQYQNNEFITTVISPNDPTDRVSVFFESFIIESGFDRLIIYDGNTTEIELGRFSGNDLEGRTFASSDISGALTFVFSSDGSVVFDGWEATVLCEPRPNCLPPLDFSPRAVGGLEAVFEWQAQGGESQWEVEYGLQGFELGSGSTNVANQSEIVVDNLQPFTSYDIYIKTICSSEGFSTVEGPLNFVTREACPVPQNIIFSDIQFSSILVDWEDLGATSWELEYGLEGFLPSNGMSLIVNESQLNIESLLTGTTYEIYLRSNCTDSITSDIVGPFKFNTPSNFCGGDLFYDSGGENLNYTNNEQTTTTIAPENSGDRIRVQFLNFALESNFDFLSVYDGSNSSAPFLGKFSGNELNGQTLTADNEEGTLTFVFASDGSVTRSGWEATVFCEPTPNCQAPFNLNVSSVFTRSALISWASNSEENGYTVEFGEEGFVLGSGTEVIESSQELLLDNLMPETTYEVYVKTNCEIGGFSDLVGPFSFTTLIACNIPQGFQSSFITSRTAGLEWNNSIDTTNGWEIEYGLSGFQQGDGTLVSANNNQFIITELTPETTYDAYLRADCGSEEGKSMWSAPIIFTTACDVFEAPFTESFVNSTLPDCWTTVDNNNWNFNTFASIDNLNFIADRNSERNTNYAWIEGATFNIFPFQNSYTLVSPSINIESRTNLALRFSVFSSNSIENSYNKLEVFIDDDSGVSVKVATIEEDTRDWKDFSVDLELIEVTSTIRIRFVASASTSNNAFDNDILIDEVQVITNPNCINPFEPRVVSIKGNSAVIDWQFLEQPENWEVVYGNENFIVENGTSALTDSNVLELINLTENTEYEFYIRSICGNNNQTDFIGPIKFNSGCTPFTAPYIEDFTTVSFNNIPSCWSTMSSNWGVSTRIDNNGRIIPDRNISNADPKYLVASGNPRSEAHQDYVYSPFIDITNLNTPSLQFSLNGNYFSFDDFRILVVDFFDGNTWNEVQRISNHTEGWKDYFIDLSEFSITSDVQIRFKQININSNFTNNIFLIDNITVDELPTCFLPSNLEVVDTTSDLVSLIWNDNNSSNLWDIEYGIDGFILGEGIQVEVVGAPNADINNLEPNTEYEFYVRANCDGNTDISSWFGPIKASTKVDFCSAGKFYDSGGEFGNYSNSENITTTILPNSTDERVRVVFNTFNLESCCDRLLIYNGTDTNSPLIGSFNNLNTNNRTFISTDISGALTFVFITDGSVTRSGWDANVFCEPLPNCSLPSNLSVENVGSTQVDVLANLVDSLQWEIEYGFFGFEIGEGLIQDSTGETITIINLEPNTTYQVYAKAICNQGGFSDITDPISFTTNIRCERPISFRNTLQSRSSLEFDWVDFGANLWELEYGVAGFSQGSGQQLTTELPEIVINNLNTDTSYDIYVRAVCAEDDKSEYISLLNIRTAPNFCSTGVFLDSGGEFGNYLNNENLTTIIEPDNNSEAVSVTFNEFDLELGYDYLAVFDSNNSNDGFLGRFSGSELINITFEATNNSGALTFVFTSDEIVPQSGWNASVVCRPISNCSTPTDIQALNIAATSAVISWEDISSNLSWELQYGIQGFLLNTGIVQQTSQTESQLLNLSESTAYDVYVRGECNSNEVSDWVGPITFVTTCDFLINENELIRNGSFECGSLGGWITTNDVDESCRSSFSVRQNSFDICSIVDDVFPSSGNYASFLSFDGEQNDLFTISQNVVIPDDSYILNSANFSFDFKVNYDTTLGGTANLPRTLTTSFVIDDTETILDIQSFGAIAERRSIDTIIDVDVLAILNENKGRLVTLIFSAFIPQSFTGPSKAMIDNVSLSINKTIIVEEPVEVPVETLVSDEPLDEETPIILEVPQEIVNTDIIVMPNPSNGEFSVISQEEILSIEVYGIGGILIKTVKPVGVDKEVDLRDLSSSLYILKIVRKSGETEIEKIIID